MVGFPKRANSWRPLVARTATKSSPTSSTQLFVLITAVLFQARLDHFQSPTESPGVAALNRYRFADINLSYLIFLKNND